LPFGIKKSHAGLWGTSDSGLKDLIWDLRIV
jgi:hypothetical protein